MALLAQELLAFSCLSLSLIPLTKELKNWLSSVWARHEPTGKCTINYSCLLLNIRAASSRHAYLRGLFKDCTLDTTDMSQHRLTKWWRERLKERCKNSENFCVCRSRLKASKKTYNNTNNNECKQLIYS